MKNVGSHIGFTFMYIVAMATKSLHVTMETSVVLGVIYDVSLLSVSYNVRAKHMITL